MSRIDQSDATQLQKDLHKQSFVLGLEQLDGEHTGSPAINADTMVAFAGPKPSGLLSRHSKPESEVLGLIANISWNPGYKGSQAAPELRCHIGWPTTDTAIEYPNALRLMPETILFFVQFLKTSDTSESGAPMDWMQDHRYSHRIQLSTESRHNVIELTGQGYAQVHGTLVKGGLRPRKPVGRCIKYARGRKLRFRRHLVPIRFWPTAR